MTTTSTELDDLELSSRQDRSQRAFHRVLATASPGARLIEREGGVQATIVPAAPSISVLNNVFYTDPSALEASLAEIADAYVASGVEHWAVSVPGQDRDTARLLRAAGHSRRAVPVVMGGRIDPTKQPGRNVRIELEPRPTAAMVGRLNDIAFGVSAPHTLADALQDVDDRSIRAYVAQLDGEIACGLLVSHTDRNLYTWGLAGTPEARKSLIAIRLMRVVLRDAIELGCRTVTCETTPAARAIAEYFRMRPIGHLAMWEHRTDTPN
ncbi:MAG TPA: GNAT family N-acetyltransferase [Solirubrobacteraceae bacterium]|nr:GNAT family N-acetyltransferase [Solirubrobacteraceae bacterium]